MKRIPKPMQEASLKTHAFFLTRQRRSNHSYIYIFSISSHIFLFLVFLCIFLTKLCTQTVLQNGHWLSNNKWEWKNIYTHKKKRRNEKKKRISELYFDSHSPVVNVDRLCVCHLPLMQGLSAVAPSGTPEWSFQIRNPFGLLDFFEEESKKEKKQKNESRIKENKKTRGKKRENCEKMDLAKEGFWCWQELNDR